MKVMTAAAIICGSSYFTMLTGVLRSILVMRLIGPTSQGVRRTVDMLTKYLFNAHLGILHGANKQLPIYIGQKDDRKVQEVEDVGISWTIGLTLVAALGMLIWGLSNPTGQRTTQLAIIIGAGWLLAQQTHTLYRTLLRAWGQFAVLGIVGGVDTLATFALTLLGAWKYGVLGAMGGTLAAWLISLLVYAVYSPLKIRPRFDLKIGYELVRIGLPIAAIIFADTLLRTVDGAIIVRYYQAHKFGLYSLAMQMASYLFTIPESAGFVIWPRILEAYGAAKGDSRAMRRQIVLPTITSATFMPVLAGIAFILLPPMVRIVLPQFIEAIPAARILAMASVFLALPMATNSLLIALNREMTVVVIKLIGAGVAALGCLWLVKHDGSLTQLAIAATAGYAISGVLSVLVVLPRYEPSLVGNIKVFAGIFLPFGWSCVALWLSTQAGSLFLTPAQTGWAWAFTRIFFFLLFMTPVLYYGNRQTRLLEELRNMFSPLRKIREADK